MAAKHCALIAAALLLAGCAVNQAYAPIVGQAGCMQVFDHESEIPTQAGVEGYMMYDCATLKIISTGAWPTSSFTSSLPTTVIGGAASATVPMIAK
jgi:hypothetical protein